MTGGQCSLTAKVRLIETMLRSDGLVKTFRTGRSTSDPPMLLSPHRHWYPPTRVFEDHLAGDPLKNDYWPVHGQIQASAPSGTCSAACPLMNNASVHKLSLLECIQEKHRGLALSVNSVAAQVGVAIG